MKLSKIKPNERNPRKITDEALERLAESIRRDPVFMELRPIVVGADSIIIGGNQRYKALKRLGYKEIPDDWVVEVSELSQDQRQRFMLVDNSIPGMSGDFDISMLQEDWEVPELEDLGFDPSLFEDIDVVFDADAENSNSGGHDNLNSVSFWIYDYKITDSRDHVWHFISGNKDKIRELPQEKVVDALIRGLHEILD